MAEAIAEVAVAEVGTWTVEAYEKLHQGERTARRVDCPMVALVVRLEVVEAAEKVVAAPCVAAWLVVATTAVAAAGNSVALSVAASSVAAASVAVARLASASVAAVRALGTEEGAVVAWRVGGASEGAVAAATEVVPMAVVAVMGGWVGVVAVPTAEAATVRARRRGRRHQG